MPNEREITTQITEGLIRIIKEAGLRPTPSKTLLNQCGPDCLYHSIALGQTGLRLKIKYDFAIHIHPGKAIVTGSSPLLGVGVTPKDVDFLVLNVPEDNGNHDKYAEAKKNVEYFLSQLGEKKAHLLRAAYHIDIAGAPGILDRLAMEHAEAGMGAE